ncbi:MAG: GNAT family N-acetyltransferase, partial [bacterium]|nr:GNAT family N-acetyltransferase [bacterium]
NALMYQHDGSLVPVDERMELTPVKEENLKDVVAFDQKAIGAPLDWLSGYLSNLITRRELFAFIRDGKVIATGECRGYDEYQTGFADLGVIVAKSERSKGIATKVLKSLIAIAGDRNLSPICSTEASNIGAQKAIARAGFFAGNRIVQFDHQVPDTQ